MRCHMLHNNNRPSYTAYQYILDYFLSTAAICYLGDDLFRSRPAQRRVTFVFRTALCVPEMDTVEKISKQ